MENTHDLMFSFRESLMVLNRSPVTIKSYLNHISHFLNALEVDDIKKVTRGVIEDYIARLYDHRTRAGKPYSTSSICMKVRAIKRLFEFLEHTNVIFINPAENTKEPKKDKSLPKSILSAREVNMILDQPNLGALGGIRDRAILEVFYSTGIRLDELISLTIYDTDLHGRMIRINKGKGQKDRVVPMGRHAVKLLREYISKVRPRFTGKNRAERILFVNRHGRPLSRQVVEKMVNTYTKTAMINKKVTPHTFRHTFASTLIKNGADIRAVQKMLGHACLSTTQIYIRSLGLDIKKAHEKTHPRERDTEPRNISKPDMERRLPKDEDD